MAEFRTFRCHGYRRPLIKVIVRLRSVWLFWLAALHQTVQGNGQGWLRLVERRRADLVRDVVIDLLQPLADRSHTITGDNGNGFAELERIPNKLDIDFFFAHPYAAWERGANENVNGLVRQYIPKNYDFALVTDD